MNVKELKEALSNLDPEIIVKIERAYDDKGELFKYYEELLRAEYFEEVQTIYLS